MPLRFHNRSTPLRSSNPAHRYRRITEQKIHLSTSRRRSNKVSAGLCKTSNVSNNNDNNNKAKLMMMMMMMSKTDDHDDSGNCIGTSLKLRNIDKHNMKVFSIATQAYTDLGVQKPHSR